MNSDLRVAYQNKSVKKSYSQLGWADELQTILNFWIFRSWTDQPACGRQALGWELLSPLAPTFIKNLKLEIEHFLRVPP